MLSNVIDSLSRTIQQYSPPSEWKCVSLVSFHFCFRERYPSKIRRGESIRPTSTCLPTASPLHLQYIPPPPPLSLKHRHASNHRSLWDSPTFLHFCLRSFQISSMYYSSDSGECRKSSEINNGVNTLTPKIYKFSGLISEHFLEEIV